VEERRFVTVDGNEAAASVAHRLSEVIAIYPITPSSARSARASPRGWSSASARAWDPGFREEDDDDRGR
jgi:pyruvate-ferredoxin/flavodoxin oxidoreductase